MLASGSGVARWSGRSRDGAQAFHTALLLVSCKEVQSLTVRNFRSQCHVGKPSCGHDMPRSGRKEEAPKAKLWTTHCVMPVRYRSACRVALVHTRAPPDLIGGRVGLRLRLGIFPVLWRHRRGRGGDMFRRCGSTYTIGCGVRPMTCVSLHRRAAGAVPQAVPPGRPVSSCLCSGRAKSVVDRRQQLVARERSAALLRSELFQETSCPAPSPAPRSSA